MAKIKISIPADDPRVSVELETDAIIAAVKEFLGRLPFKVEYKKKEKKGGEH